MHSSNNDIIDLNPETKLRLETTDTRTIYFLENRGYMFLSHFLWFQIGGLRHLDNTKKHIIYIPYMHELLAPSDINYILKLNYNIYLQFNKTKKEEVYINYEILNHIYPNFIFIDTLDYIKNIEDYTIINYHGERLDQQPDGHAVNPDTYIYLRNLLLTNYIPPILQTKPRRLYISRYKTLKIGSTSRNVINENNVYEMLQQYNFEKIYFEDYNLKEKMDILNSSEIIIYPQAGGVSALSAVANINLHMFEFYVPNNASGYCKSVCDTIGMRYTRFTDIHFTDNNAWNMIINIESLKNNISSILNM